MHWIKILMTIWILHMILIANHQRENTINIKNLITNNNIEKVNGKQKHTIRWRVGLVQGEPSKSRNTTEKQQEQDGDKKEEIIKNEYTKKEAICEDENIVILNTPEEIRLKYTISSKYIEENKDNTPMKILATHKVNPYAKNNNKTSSPTTTSSITRNITEKMKTQDKQTPIEKPIIIKEKKEWVEIPTWIAKEYDAKPIIISNEILHLNASEAFYRTIEHLKEPQLDLWVISKRIYQTAYSNKRIYEYALQQNINIRLLAEDGFDLMMTNNTVDILYDGKQLAYPDFVIPRIGSRINHYGMAVIMQLDKMEVPMLNDFAAHYVSRDKYYQLQNLAEHSIPIPKTLILGNRELNVDTVAELLTTHFKSFPIVLKRLQGLQGKGILLLQNMDGFREIYEMMDHSSPYLFQEYISESEGRDIRIIVIGGRAVGSMMRVAKSGFKSNFHLGGYVKPVKLTPQMEWLAIEAANKLGMGIAGVDVLIDKNTYRICEVNSSPGFEGFEMATGVNVPEQLIDYVKVRLTKWHKPESEFSKTS